MCTLSVETTVCGFQSNVSEAATALLKGTQKCIKVHVALSSFSMILIVCTIAPGRPIISKELPYYNLTSRQLIKIDVQVESDPNVSALTL